MVEQPPAREAPQVQHRRLPGRDAVRVAVDEQLVVVAVDRVVERRRVQPHGDVRLVERLAHVDERKPDPSRQPVADALLCSAQRDRLGVGIAVEQPDLHAVLRLAAHQRGEIGAAVGKEEPGVHQDVEPLARRLEQLVPALVRHSAAMRIERAPARRRCRRGRSLSASSGQSSSSSTRSSCAVRARLRACGSRPFVIHRSAVLTSISTCSATSSSRRPACWIARRSRSFAIALPLFCCRATEGRLKRPS